MRRIYRYWRNYWLRFAGGHGFGRLAARLAAWDTMPYHGRAFLADLTPRGFIAHTAALAHPGLRIGANVYVGDNVIARCVRNGGSVELHDKVQLYGNTFIETGLEGRISIGAGTHIQPGCHIHAFLSEISIGRSVEIAPQCAFYSYDHSVALGEVIMKQPPRSKGGITVGDGAWLGHGVIVLDGVRIGPGAVIGAGSVVVRDIPENAIAAGVPARVVRFRDQLLTSSTK
jgi:acetyltransferase-like isoleucine patch superfamily enzyme